MKGLEERRERWTHTAVLLLFMISSWIMSLMRSGQTILQDFWANTQVHDGLALDLGCGTGSLTEIPGEERADMIGIDNSEDKASRFRHGKAGRFRIGHPLYLLPGYARRFELYGTVAAVVSICDSMNYLTDYEGSSLRH